MQSRGSLAPFGTQARGVCSLHTQAATRGFYDSRWRQAWTRPRLTCGCIRASRWRSICGDQPLNTWTAPASDPPTVSWPESNLTVGKLVVRSVGLLISRSQPQLPGTHRFQLLGCPALLATWHRVLVVRPGWRRCRRSSLIRWRLVSWIGRARLRPIRLRPAGLFELGLFDLGQSGFFST